MVGATSLLGTFYTGGGSTKSSTITSGASPKEQLDEEKALHQVLHQEVTPCPLTTTNRKRERATTCKESWHARVVRAKGLAETAAAEETPVGDLVLKEEGQKQDDAEVPVRLWDMHLATARGGKLEEMPIGWRKSLATLRRFFLRVWRRTLTRSFFLYRQGRLPRSFLPSTSRPTVVGTHDGTFGWAPRGRFDYRTWHQNIANHPGSSSDIKAGRECVEKASGATWWEWNEGSRLFFWRWPDRARTWARSGQPHMLLRDLPRFQKPQKKPATQRDRTLVAEKVGRVRSKGYIAPGPVKSLTHYFYVPKGESDIRMVYNGTSCGLNDCLFAPHFGLPVIRHALRSLLPGYHQADIDVAEMFLNFNLGEALQPYSGVDLTPLGLAELGKRLWEHWTRNFMGLRDSPYRSIQLMIIAKHVAYGNHLDRENPFHWEEVILNLPGSWAYDPTLPWVFKVRYDGHLSCEVYIYVDDGKVTGWRKVACWKAAAELTKVMAKLGLQDAARKRTEPSTTPGPWAGSVVHTNASEVTLLVSDKKWQKTQATVRDLVDRTTANSEVERKALERIRGFLIYVSRTYRWMVPYLKGIHLTIDSWREDRDREGYRKKRPKAVGKDGNWMWNWEQDRWYDADLEPPEEARQLDAPDLVTGVPRLKDDAQALLLLTGGEIPPKVIARPKHQVDVVYMIGDASGKGFGTAMWAGGSL